MYTEKKAKVVAAVWGMCLYAALAIMQEGWFEGKFLEEYPLWEGSGLEWCKQEDHPMFWIIHSAKCPFFYSSISSNNPGAKICSAARNRIHAVPQTATTTFCLLFCIHPSCMGILVSHPLRGPRWWWARGVRRARRWRACPCSAGGGRWSPPRCSSGSRRTSPSNTRSPQHVLKLS